MKNFSFMIQCNPKLFHCPCKGKTTHELMLRKNKLSIVPLKGRKIRIATLNLITTNCHGILGIPVCLYLDPNCTNCGPPFDEKEVEVTLGGDDKCSKIRKQFSGNQV